MVSNKKVILIHDNVVLPKLYTRMLPDISSSPIPQNLSFDVSISLDYSNPM